MGRVTVTVTVACVRSRPGSTARRAGQFPERPGAARAWRRGSQGLVDHGTSADGLAKDPRTPGNHAPNGFAGPGMNGERLVPHPLYDLESFSIAAVA